MIQTLWQDALNPQLTQRLLRPLVCPGVIPDTLAMAIFERSRQFKQRLSLLHQFQQRWNKQLDLQVPDIPIVYAHWVAPAVQSVVSENPSDRNQEGSSESIRIEREHTTSTQTVIQQPANRSTDSTSPSLPLVIQAKFVNPAASNVTSHLPPIPSDSTLPQSSIIEDRESALPRVSADAASTPQYPQLPILTASPRSPLMEPELNRGISSVEEQALVVKAKNQPVVPTSSQLTEQKPQMRSLATNQLPLSSATSPPTGSGLKTTIAASKSSSQPLEELPLIKLEKVAALSFSQALRQPTQPMVFARSAPIQVPYSKQELPMMQSASNHQSTERSPIVNAQPTNQTLSTPAATSTQPSVNISHLTQQVERKLMRKLTVERERRGQQIWH